MKANAPEKIYTDENGNNPLLKRHCDSDIEYIRTDAFIEKVVEFIRKGGKRGDAYIVTEFGEEVFDFVQFSEDFIAHIKGK